MFTFGYFKTFLRACAVVHIFIMTDEMDCSTL